MKRLFMECIGTFFLTLAVAYTNSPLTIGLILMTMAYIGGRISGGHYNPAITIAAFDVQKLISDFFSHIQVYCGYFGAQILGACMAIYFVMRLTGSVFAPEIFAEFSLYPAFCMEALLTMIFCWVYLTVTVLPMYRNTAVGGAVIGLALMAIASFGGLFNPAIAIASMLCERFMGESLPLSYASYMVYIFGPIFGGLIASILFNFFSKD